MLLLRDRLRGCNYGQGNLEAGVYLNTQVDTFGREAEIRQSTFLVEVPACKHEPVWMLLLRDRLLFEGLVDAMGPPESTQAP